MQWSDEGQQAILLLLFRRIEEVTRLMPAAQSHRSSWVTMGYRVMMLSHWRGWATKAIMWFWRSDLRVASLSVFSSSCRFGYLIVGIELGVDAQWLYSGASADKMPYDATFSELASFPAFSVCCQTIIIINNNLAIDDWVSLERFRVMDNYWRGWTLQSMMVVWAVLVWAQLERTVTFTREIKKQ